MTTTAALTWQELRDQRLGYSRCEATRTQGAHRGERCTFRGRYDGLHGKHLCVKHLEQAEQELAARRTA